MSRILLADDHPMIRTALEVLLRGTQHVIAGMAATADEAVDQFERVAPDLVLLDLQMPGGGGMAVLRKLKADDRRVRVILLTAAIDDSQLLEARSLQVQGIVLKNSDPAYLLDCLDRAEHGLSWIDPELKERVKALEEAWSTSKPVSLTPRERQLIGYVRQGFRNREIATELGVTEGTVKAYMHKLFDKLGVANRTELAIGADGYLGRRRAD